MRFGNITKALDWSSPYTKQPDDDNLPKKGDASMITNTLPELKREEKEKLMKWLCDYTGFINGSPRMTNLLHFACTQTKSGD